MDGYLRPFQRECIENLLNKIESGVTRISVAMTTNSGKTTTLVFLADELINRYSNGCVLVFKHRLLCEQAKLIIERLKKSKEIKCVTVNEFLNNTQKIFKYCIIDDASVFERKQISDAIKDEKVVTVSIFSLEQENIEAKKAETYVESSAPIVCVCETKDILDIRDMQYANDAEILFIKNEVSKETDLLITKRMIIETERDKVQNRFNRLQAYLKAFRQMKDPNAINNQAKALLQADKSDERIKDLETLEKEYKKQLKEKDDCIAQLNQMIWFFKSLFSSIGISTEIIEESFKQIQKLRESLIDELESQDEEIKEVALKKLQDKVAELVGELTKNVISVTDNADYKEYLIGKLTQEVWDKLDEKSRELLITAKSNYDSMTKMPNKDSMDYSGVCLLVTKALEIEITKRFFDNYKVFLNRKYASVSQWPHVLRKRIRGQVTDEVIPDGAFTLGSVVPTVGYKREYDANDKIVGYSRGHNGTRLDFLDYATRNLFKSSDRSSAEREIEKDYLFIEKVRLDYRNPSAHKGKVTITSAKNCMEYVIDVQHMLKEILETMKI